MNENFFHLISFYIIWDKWFFFSSRLAIFLSVLWISEKVDRIDGRPRWGDYGRTGGRRDRPTAQLLPLVVNYLGSEPNSALLISLYLILLFFLFYFILFYFILFYSILFFSQSLLTFEFPRLTEQFGSRQFKCLIEGSKTVIIFFSKLGLRFLCNIRNLLIGGQGWVLRNETCFAVFHKRLWILLSR